MLFNFRNLNVFKSPFHQYWVIFWSAQTIISAVEISWVCFVEAPLYAVITDILSCHAIVHEARKDCVTSKDFVTTKNKWQEGFLNVKDSLLCRRSLDRHVTHSSQCVTWRVKERLRRRLPQRYHLDFKIETELFTLKSAKFSFKITQKGDTKH